jgi:hypothetical protein
VGQRGGVEARRQRGDGREPVARALVHHEDAGSRGAWFHQPLIIARPGGPSARIASQGGA